MHEIQKKFLIICPEVQLHQIKVDREKSKFSTDKIDGTYYPYPEKTLAFVSWLRVNASSRGNQGEICRKKLCFILYKEKFLSDFQKFYTKMI